MFGIILLFVFLLLAFALLFFSIKNLINIYGPLDKFKFQINTYFVKGYRNHNEITKLIEGKCVIKIESMKIHIIQGDNQVTDYIKDIDHFRIWKFKNGLYLAIETKTYNEYMFSLIKSGDEQAEVVYAVFYNMVGNLAKRLKVKFIIEQESEDE